MATDDQQVLVTGTASAPASFTIPGNGQIRPKAVFASYDGTGAAAAFLPALKVVSDGGEVVGIYPTQTQVAAGASADVSWFPWLAAGAGAGPGPPASVVMPYVRVAQGSWNWPSGVDTGVNWTGASVQITNTTVFTNNIGVDPTVPILVNKAGIYLMWAGVGPWLPAWGTQASLRGLGPDFGNYFAMGQSATNFPTSFTPAGGDLDTLVTVTGAILNPDPVGGSQVSMDVFQSSGATRNVSAAFTIIQLTGNGAGA